jgi:DNA-binding response OmpR family regulator
MRFILWLEPVPLPVKMLAFISSPLDLADHERLDMEREQEILLQAANGPAGQGRLALVFEDEAKPAHSGEMPGYGSKIVDVMLPKMDGYKICQLLKADPKYKTIPIIISSGRTPQEVRKVSKEVGADAFVSKPFEAEELLSK